MDVSRRSTTAYSHTEEKNTSACLENSSPWFKWSFDLKCWAWNGMRYFLFLKMNARHFRLNGIILVMLVEEFIFLLLHAFKQTLELPGDNIKQPLRCICTWRSLLISSTLYSTAEKCACVWWDKGWNDKDQHSPRECNQAYAFTSQCLAFAGDFSI